MKLIEIFNTEISQNNYPRQELRNAEWRKSRAHLDYDKDTIGHGASYKATKDKDPHIVKKDSRKVNTNNSMRDGYHTYAEAIIMNELAQDNPFLPRFYDYHIDRDESGNRHYSFKTERLFSATDKKIRQIPFNTFTSTVLKDIFSTDKEKKKFMRNFMYEMEQYDDDPDITEKDYHELFSDEIGWYLGEMIDNKNFSAASNKLNRALKLISDLLNKHRLSNDLHGQNIMYRLGPHGVQLVLNDPLA
jgi:hypothetical protein